VVPDCSITTSRTEQCIILNATQEGEIPSAPTTPAWLAQIIEKMHHDARSQMVREHGRHEIFAGGKNVKMDSVEHALVLKDELVTNEEQHDLDKAGIAKNSREEKMRARDAKQKKIGYTPAWPRFKPRGRVEREAVVAENGFIPLGALTNPAMAAARFRRRRSRSPSAETDKQFLVLVSRRRQSVAAFFRSGRAASATRTRSITKPAFWWFPSCAFVTLVVTRFRMRASIHVRTPVLLRTCLLR